MKPLAQAPHLTSGPIAQAAFDSCAHTMEYEMIIKLGVRRPPSCPLLARARSRTPRRAVAAPAEPSWDERTWDEQEQRTLRVMETCWEALEELEELKAVWANSADTRIDRWLRAEVMGLLEVEPELAVTLLALMDQMAELEVEPELAVTLLALMDQMAEVLEVLVVLVALAVLLVY